MLRNMKIFARMSLGLGLSTTLFLAALALAVTGMTEIRGHLRQLLEHDQVLTQAVNDMYGQGLQMGQALRNIVMDPSNKIAYDNMAAAANAFKAAHDTALRLGRYFKVTPELWMGLQTEYDLRVARRTT